MPGGGGIKDNNVILIGLEIRDELFQGGHLLGAGGVQVLPYRFQGVLIAALQLRQDSFAVFIQCLLLVYPGCKEVGNSPDSDRDVPYLLPEDVVQMRCGVGGQQQRLKPPPGQIERSETGDRALTHAPFAQEEYIPRPIYRSEGSQDMRYILRRAFKTAVGRGLGLTRFGYHRWDRTFVKGLPHRFQRNEIGRASCRE